ncbi:MAG: cysteine desulfurase [Gemmatimonadota bacterium]|nr:cysteine desulfurase [Gemmatimonadota bacterium]
MDHVYLDYAATTPVRDEVRAAMAPYLSGVFGNPSSVHRWGREAEEALEQARAELAESLGAEPSEITFVRGGTESDNLALLGWCGGQRALDETPTVAISSIEHHAVLEAVEFATRTGLARSLRIGVTPEGAIDADAIRDAVADGPTLVSVMWVNNESGMVLPLQDIAGIVKAAGATLHTDAAQAVGKVPVDVRELPVDLLSGTGHKIYAPKGTGFLFVREGTPLAPLLHGGGQERGVRPGTEDVAGAVGLATAVRLAVAERASETSRLLGLRDRLEVDLLQALDGIRVNAGEAPRAPHVLSVGLAGIEDGSALVMALDLEGIAVSGGSACASGSAKASHVMEALYGNDDPYAAVRFSLGKGTTNEHLQRAVTATVAVVTRMRDA